MVETTEKAINLEDTAAELEIQIAELEREPSQSFDEKSPIKATPKPAVVDTSAPPKTRRADVQEMLAMEPEAPKTDELEALWPGVHQDFMHPVKKTPSFYLMLGFIGGAVLSLMLVWGYSSVSQQIASNSLTQDKPILIAQTDAENAQGENSVPMTTKNTDPTAPLEPISKFYEVKPGDTLVSIALKNYRKVTPRLIDSIVEQNNLKNANVLNLGQKLKLPTYQPQIATPGTGQVL